MFDYVLFDLDGTLTRSGDGIKKSAAYAIARLGYAPLSDAQLDKFVGPPLLEMFMTLCGMDEPTALKAVGFYRERFESVGWRETPSTPASPRFCAPCARRASTWPSPRPSRNTSPCASPNTSAWPRI